MGPQIVRRLLVSVPALLGVLFLCFCLMQVVPTDPAQTRTPTTQISSPGRTGTAMPRIPTTMMNAAIQTSVPPGTSRSVRRVGGGSAQSL